MALYCTNFTSIGKAVLHGAVGLQSNYSFIERVPACSNCPAHKNLELYKDFSDSEEYIKARNTCEICPHVKAHKEYRNESNQYGTRKCLNTNALLLFLLYHFLQPDENGIVRNVSVQEIADLLSVKKKTIINNNKILSDRGYIYTSSSYDLGTINIWIRDYKSYFMNANQGGRGYLTLSKDTFQSLSESHSINFLRIQIKELLEIDDHSILGKTTIRKTYHELQRFLPSYCKRHIIQKLFQTTTSIFHTSTTDNYIDFSLPDTFPGKTMKEQYVLENKEKIAMEIESIQKAIQEKKKHPALKFYSGIKWFDCLPITEYAALNLTNAQINDLANLSVQFSLNHVLRALSVIYENFICMDTQIRSFGGLARRIIQQQLQEDFKTA